MNINRNNYEEYFLLYADKELSAAEKINVEMFVKDNPDLEEEFLMIQQSVVKPDLSETLEDKSFLLQKGFIDISNYEERFLLYTDNELTATEAIETEKFAARNPQLEQEFKLLQQVTFEPDTSIVFPDKELLYRKEKEHKIIPFPWRYLAAAILLGAGLWMSIVYMQKEKAQPEIVIKPTFEKTTPALPVDKNKIEEPVNPVVNIQKTNGPAPRPVLKQEILTPQPQEQTAKNDPVQNNPVVNPDTVKTLVVKLDNNLPKPEFRIADPRDKPVTEIVSEQNNITQNNFAQHASYIQDAEAKSENYVFYNITAEEFKKSKIGNFLKRVKRTIEKKIPLRGNGLKIGNVEIAKDDQN